MENLLAYLNVQRDCDLKKFYHFFFASLLSELDDRLDFNPLNFISTRKKLRKNKVRRFVDQRLLYRMPLERSLYTIFKVLRQRKQKRPV